MRNVDEHLSKRLSGKAKRISEKKKKKNELLTVQASSDVLQLAPGEEEEEEDVFKTEHTVSASEDEAESDQERKHQKLLDAITSLDGKKRRRIAERSEATLQVSEFGISSEGAGDKIELYELLGKLESASPSLATVKKQLNKLRNKNRTLEVPLSKQETEKAQRAAAFVKARQNVKKWDRVVLQNRKAEQLVFPLSHEPVKTQPLELVVSGWKARTPLEEEIFNLLHKNKQPVTDPLLTPAEEDSLKAMSLEEARMRRAELQKARALQSYYEAKARRQRKIKSKKYHKLMKKAKQKEVLKEFDELRKKNPEAALEELQKMEKQRIQERMTLKHQNSGKWARNKAIMAKYDLEARKAIQEQLEKNKELTKKTVVISDSEEEKGEAEEEMTVPDFVNDVEAPCEGANPWMQGKLTRETGVQEHTMEPSSVQEEAKMMESKEEEEGEEALSEDEALLQEFEERRHLRKRNNDMVPVTCEESVEIDSGGKMDQTTEMTAGDGLEEEEEEVAEFNGLFQKLEKKKDTPKNAKVVEVIQPEVCEIDNLEKEEEPMLDETLERKQTFEDMATLHEEEDMKKVYTPKKMDSPGPKHTDSLNKENVVIDPSKVMVVPTTVIQSASVPLTVQEEEEGEDDQRIIIKEAFAGDDVIDDFVKEKRSRIEADKPKDIDLTLPGWGEWGGVGLKPSQKKRKRFIVKAPPATVRKDQRLPNVIINEKRVAATTAHQVSELPFPFESRQQFERSLQAPIGNTWNTQRAVQKLTAPKVITKLGCIIDPISEHVTFLQKNTSRVPEVDIKLHTHRDRKHNWKGKNAAKKRTEK
ncbi:U3 small nucleolar RNA-associated protein 14 homolog A-like [Protopterus annectens]|uniref:U3 small nucleolar RNA-associated protein 14 homolog A-like n=1 Tax=Protopterus annectens TaxID=7888 RepID=UPI001CFA477A|nr:U3 small nucleolar RNA-associated protein 14 homolog A-like [Protopterus annectens]